MHKMKLFPIVVILCSSYTTVSSLCSFPSGLVGTWESPSQGYLTFNDTHLTGYDVNVYTGLEFECYLAKNNKYILRSDNFTLLGLNNIVNAALCVKFTKQSAQKYTYFILTSELSDASYERVKFIQSTDVVTISDICDDTSIVGTPQETKLLVENGTALSEAIQCPNDILGTYWYYNLTSCSESYWDVCSTSSQMTFNYTLCSETQAFSGNGIVHCMYSVKNGRDSVIYIYNEDSTVDDSTTYQYSCMVVRKESGLVYVTQYPQDCYTNQTYEWVPSGGVSIILSANVPSSPSSGSSTGLVICLVIFLILGAGGAVAGYYVYTKKFKQIDPNEKRIIDKEKSVVSTDTRRMEAVTPSVVKPDLTSPRNSVSHGKITQLLGPEYTMTNQCDDSKINDVTELTYDELESARKLPAIVTGTTPRDALSPLDTQLKKPQLPPIP